MFTELTILEQQNISGGDVWSDLWEAVKTTGEVVAGTVAIRAGYAQIGMGIATANPLLVATGVLSVGTGGSLIDHAVTKANSR